MIAEKGCTTLTARDTQTYTYWYPKSLQWC